VTTAFRQIHHMQISKSLVLFFDKIDRSADSTLALVSLIKDLPEIMTEVSQLSDAQFSQLLKYSESRFPQKELSEIVAQIFITMRSICTNRTHTSK
jgi:hypothetical protein